MRMQTSLKYPFLVSLSGVISLILIYFSNNSSSTYNYEEGKILIEVLRNNTSQDSSQHIYTDNRFDLMNETEKSKLVKESFLRSEKLLQGIHQRCKASKITPLRWSYDNFKTPRKLIYRESINVVYASNPKTGSSSFKKFFFKLDGVVNPVNVHYRHGHYDYMTRNTLSKEEFRSSLKIGAIRNPAVRLISAFRDKVIRQKNYKHVLNPAKENLTDPELFVRFLHLGYENNERYTWFWMNRHFISQWDAMLICSFPYDLLIQYENGNTDIDAIQIITNTTNIEYSLSRKDSGTDFQSSGDVANKWLSELDKKDLNIIYSIYEMDYKILGYSKWGDKNFPFVKEDKFE